MPISALSSNLVSDLSQQQENPFRQVRQDFQQLATALQNGDLSQAQSAYSNIQQILGNNGGSSGSSSGTTGSSGSSTLQNDFAALGQALQSGDLSQAQSAFSQLQSDAQAGWQTGGAGGPGWGSDWGNGWNAGQDQYVSSSSQSQNPVEEAIQDYSQLANDIQNGDLTDAQTAYSNLQQLVQSYQGSAASNSTIQNDFTTLGQDIQSGSLSATQSAFSQLQSDLQAAVQTSSQSATAQTSTTQTQSQPQTQTLTLAQQVQQDYAQLESALQNGNLSGAQSAFSALEQALQTQTGSAATSSSNTNSNDPIANALNNLGQALSSGNLSQAQSWFSQLQDDIQAAQPGTAGSQNSGQAQQANDRRADSRHHHHGGDWSNNQSSSSTASASNSYTASTSGSSVNVYA